MLIKKQTGFTLIELAVVMVIVAIIAGSFIGTFADRVEATRRDNTNKELKEIKTVLMAFAFSQPNPYLPCPDTNVPPDGQENRDATGVCTGAIGVFPWMDLGIGHEDAWGMHYRYWVHANYSTAPPGASFLLGTADNAGTILTKVGNAVGVLGLNAVAVIFSHGENSYAAVSTAGINQPAIPAANVDEIENTDADTSFFSRTPSGKGAAAAGGEYDDIVVWINSFELKAKMVEVGALP